MHVCWDGMPEWKSNDRLVSESNGSYERLSGVSKIIIHSINQNWRFQLSLKWIQQKKILYTFKGKSTKWGKTESWQAKLSMRSFKPIV